MSQHYFFTELNDEPIKVQMGYDRPLDGYFMVIEKLNEPDEVEETEDDEDDDDYRDETLLYSNLYQPHPYPNSLDSYLAVLNEMGIVVPQQMLNEITQDWVNRVGNKVVYHSLKDGEYTRDQAY